MPPLPYTRLIHENLSIILTFAYSLRPIENVLDRGFRGEWKFLRKTIYEIGGQNAMRAAIELAAFLRLLDDAEKISSYIVGTGMTDYGQVFKQDGTAEPLYLRDMTNKIVHATDWRWNINSPDQPKLVCISDDPDRWVKAEVDIERLAALCGLLMH